ncbi:MAG: RsmB/NOP family class I SAM-dependent RNA methyltransferase, partial [Alphaproteobacteria bacterium]
GFDLAAIEQLFSGERFAPEAITPGERERLQTASLDDAPAPIAGDFPEWLEDELMRAFAGDLIEEVRALATRAPIDIRVNTLKTERAIVVLELRHLGAALTAGSPTGLRFPAGEDGRGPTLQSTPEFVKGLFEIQDEGSQLVALLAVAGAGLSAKPQIVDLCAGGGGKTLALAALVANAGQIYATDADARRLAPIHDRLTRADVRNVQVRTPKLKTDEPLSDLAGKIDLVLIDAPCTGVGTWRRNPDAKWRIRPGALAERVKDQDLVLDRAAKLARPGGVVAYITCSVLPTENDDRVTAFLARHPDFSVVPPQEILALAPDALSERQDLVTSGRLGLQLSPARTETDGFYLALMRRA